jgi:hypothetical protein
VAGKTTREVAAAPTKDRPHGDRHRATYTVVDAGPRDGKPSTTVTVTVTRGRKTHQYVVAKRPLQI